MTQTPQKFSDPVEEHRALHETESRIAIAGHPLHAMLVAFPIALAMSVLGADLLYWWTGDAFWTRAAGLGRLRCLSDGCDRGNYRDGRIAGRPRHP
jgi:hypothetical protein